MATDEVMVTSGSLAVLRNLRGQLAASDEGFQKAAQIERAAETFCGNIRDKLRARREDLGLSQKSLADRLELSQSAVSKIESGCGDFSLKILFRFAKALDFELDVLFGSSTPATTRAQALPSERAAAAVAAAATEIARQAEIVQDVAARFAAAE